MILTPLRGLVVIYAARPTACAVGCILSPLRGCRSRARVGHLRVPGRKMLDYFPHRAAQNAVTDVTSSEIWRHFRTESVNIRIFQIGLVRGRSSEIKRLATFPHISTAKFAFPVTNDLY